MIEILDINKVNCSAEVRMERENRRDCQIEVTVVTPQRLSFSATVTNISASAVGLKSTKLILPKDQVSILMKLKDEIELLGTAIWTLDSSQHGEIMYNIGVQTDAIISPNKKAYEFSDRAEVVKEILYEGNAQGLTATGVN